MGHLCPMPERVVTLSDLSTPPPNTEGIGANPKGVRIMRSMVSGGPIRVSADLMNVRDRGGNAFGEIKGYRYTAGHGLAASFDPPP